MELLINQGHSFEADCIYYGGLLLCALAFIAAVAALLISYFSGKRIRRRLQNEYGKKRR